MSKSMGPGSHGKNLGMTENWRQIHSSSLPPLVPELPMPPSHTPFLLLAVWMRMTGGFDSALPQDERDVGLASSAVAG